MAYDPYERVFRPTTQANAEMPSWVPMEDDQQESPNISPFVDMLKKRMAGPQQADPGGGATRPRTVGMSSPSGGGGMQSL